jgi:hypothetical protein
MSKSITLPDNYQQLDTRTQALVTAYITDLSEIETKAYMIARAHLGSSFNLVKSNGFNDWLKEREKAREKEREKKPE